MSAALPQRTLKFDRVDPSVFKRMARSGMREDMTTRAAYSSDASIFRRIPKAVIEPKSVDDIRDGIMIAKHLGWSVISRGGGTSRSEEHTSELQSRFDLVCRLLLEKKKKQR